MKTFLHLGLGLAFVSFALPAAAETVTRKVVRVDELPYVATPAKLAPAQVALPQVKEGAAIPASWKTFSDDSGHGKCFDNRTSSVSGWGGGDEAETMKIFEASGKAFLDRATISLKDGKVAVKEATRVPVMKVLDAGSNVVVWGYRRDKELVLVSAIDSGEFGRAIFFGCRIEERTSALPTQSISFASSAKQATEVANQVFSFGDETKKKSKRAFWAGENFSVEASTSKSAADPGTMLALFLRR